MDINEGEEKKDGEQQPDGAVGPEEAGSEGAAGAAQKEREKPVTEMDIFRKLFFRK